MTRGLRGATTVTDNDGKQIVDNTKALVEDMVRLNDIAPEQVSHVFISVTKDLNAGFPAKALRLIPGWTYVPVMCMAEIDVPGSLPKCIRIMMVVNTDKKQETIEHVFHHDAKQLRPDLMKKKGE